MPVANQKPANPSEAPRKHSKRTKLAILISAIISAIILEPFADIIISLKAHIGNKKI
jgi:hypothetical protein